MGSFLVIAGNTWPSVTQRGTLQWCGFRTVWLEGEVPGKLEGPQAGWD